MSIVNDKMKTNAQKAPAKWALDGIRCIFANFSVVFNDAFRKLTLSLLPTT